MSITASELAGKLGARLEGDGSAEIRGVAGIREAQPGELAFVANPRYAADAASTRAGAVLVPSNWDRPCGSPAVLRADHPDRAFAQAAMLFAPPPVVPSPGVHPTAVIAPDAKLGEKVSVGPHAVIEPGVSVGDRTVVSAGCYIGHGVTIGQDCRLYPHVSIREHCAIGSRCILHNGVVVGSDGFGYTVDGSGVRHKIPQTGIVVIGDDVEIGANTTIDRARFGKTRIGNGVKIDNLVQIAHNVVIGDHAVIVAQVGVAGSSQIGARAQLGGQVGIAGHIVIGEGASVGAQSGVPQDVPPNAFVLGSPAVPASDEKRRIFNVLNLPKLKHRVAELEKRIQALEQKPE